MVLVQHNYRDHSQVAYSNEIGAYSNEIGAYSNEIGEDAGPAAQDQWGDDERKSRCTKQSVRNFSMKLHDMLEDQEGEEDGIAHIVSWQPHGRCFLVHKQKEFVEKVLPLYVSLKVMVARRKNGSV